MEKNTKNKELQEPVVPFEVVVEDTENAIIAIINQSNLPTCIVSNILSNLSSQYSMITKNIANQKRAENNKQLMEYENASKQED